MARKSLLRKESKRLLPLSPDAIDVHPKTSFLIICSIDRFSPFQGKFPVKIIRVIAGCKFDCPASHRRYGISAVGRRISVFSGENRRESFSYRFEDFNCLGAICPSCGK